MKFENTEVMNFEGAFRGLRNPLNSWAKSDSKFGKCSFDDLDDFDVVNAWMQKIFPDRSSEDTYTKEYYKEEDGIVDWIRHNAILHADEDTDCVTYAFLGPNDLDLAQRMITAGSPNDKFLRQIFVSVDITGPLYW